LGKILLVNTGPSEPMSDKGEHKAPPQQWTQTTVGRLLEYHISAVYYCPSPSALETAEAIANKFSLTPVALPGFKDEGFSSWKGPDAYEALSMNGPCSDGKGRPLQCKRIFGIDIEELRPKLAGSLDGITGQHKAETVAIVTDRTLTVVMILHFLHMSNNHYHQIAQEKGAINLFEVRAGMPSALYINDICHLKSLL
jgi:broad specificity phosphatase PhoE